MVKFTSTFVAASLFVCSALAAPIFSRIDNAAVTARSLGTMYGDEIVEYASRSPNKKYNHPSQGYSQWVDALRTREYGNGGGHRHPHNGQHPNGHGSGGGVERRSFDDEMVEFASRSSHIDINDKKYHHPSQSYSQWVDTLRTRAQHDKIRAGQHPHPQGHPSGQSGSGARGVNAASNSGDAERRSLDDYSGDLVARRGGGSGGHHGW